jgi:hypothetical protein
MLRRVNRDHILISYQLPTLQFLVWAVTRCASGIVAVRLMMALLASPAALAFHDLASRSCRLARRTRWRIALRHSALPPISPIREILLSRTRFAAFHSAGSGRHRPSFSAWNACPRFGAWPACPVPAAAWLRRAGKRCGVFCGAPIGWILFRWSLSPQGSLFLNRTISFARLSRPATLPCTMRETPVPVPVLTVAGLLAVSGPASSKAWTGGSESSRISAFIRLRHPLLRPLLRPRRAARPRALRDRRAREQVEVLPPDAQRTVIPLCAFRTARCLSTAKFRLTPPGLRCGASSPLLWLGPPKPAGIRHLADRRPRLTAAVPHRKHHR